MGASQTKPKTRKHGHGGISIDRPSTDTNTKKPFAVKSQQDIDLTNNIIDNYDNDDIKELNGIIAQYFYSLLLYKNVIFHRIDNYKLHIKNAEKGDNVSQYYIGNCYCYGINTKKDFSKAIEWYSKSSEGGNIKAMLN